MKFKSRAQRIDETFINDLLRAGAVRVEKKLSRCTMREMSMPRISNLATRCPSYSNLLDELSKLPEKKNE